MLTLQEQQDNNALKQVVIQLSDSLTKAPESQLDPCMQPLISKWDKPARAIQVLEVLDACVHAGLASPLVISMLQVLLENAISLEGITYKQVVELAVWRNNKL